MPHLNPDDAATDEPKTYNDEAIGGDDSNDLHEIKVDLVDEDDGDAVPQSYKNKNLSRRNESSKENMSTENPGNDEPGRSDFPYPIDPFAPGIAHPFLQGNFLPSSQVPYSHYMRPYLFCGPTSPMDLDRKQGMSRIPHSEVPPMYPLPGQLGQIPNPLAPWTSPSLYPFCSASAMAGMLRYPYPFPNFTTSGGVGCVSPFPLAPPHSNGIRPEVARAGNHLFPRHVTNDLGKASEKKAMEATKRSKNSTKPSRPYVKKPLNAFMIYMKEQRARVVAECTLKESAAINRILGKKWHSLEKAEQQKYYEMARKERQRHLQMHPSWSARDNYGKRKKRKKEKVQDCLGQNAKKCRAVFGLEQQHMWCAPCRRKKKCIRYHPDGEDSDDSDGSFHQFQEAPTSSNSSPSQPITSCDGPTHSGASQSRTPNYESSTTPLDLSELNVKRERSPLYEFDSGRSCVDTSPGDSHVMSTDRRRNVNTDNCKNGINPNIMGSVPPGHDFEESLRKLTSSFAVPHSLDTRGHHRAASSNSDLSSSNSSGGKQNLYSSPLLSPASMTSPHPNPSLLPNLSYLAAAAGLPTSPLSGLIGFANFNGISPMQIGPGSPVGSLGHVTSSSSRLNSSAALEGRS